MNPEPVDRDPFWDYQDLAVFVGLVFPALLLTALLMKVASPFASKRGMTVELTGLIFQFVVLYGLLFGALAAIFRLRYQRPFWRSLGWVKSKWTGVQIALGPALAIVVGLGGQLLNAPRIELEPMKALTSTRTSLILLGLCVGFLGPLCEELAFRGFLMPLLSRSMGPWLGILVTAFLFAALHAPEYAWSWRHVLLILVAGAAFGFVRNQTRSTMACTALHCSYNLTFLSAFLSQQGAIPKQW
jgi:membrane protease YdiL (CAAX protease family)